MDIRSSEKNGVLLIEVNGEINISTSPDLKKVFEKEAKKKIIVNLEKVSYVDSAVIATLVEMLKKTKSQGGSLCLAAMSEKVKSLFEITKLDRLFSIVSSTDEALTRLQ